MPERINRDQAKKTVLNGMDLLIDGIGPRRNTARGLDGKPEKQDIVADKDKPGEQGLGGALPFSDFHLKLTAGGITEILKHGVRIAF